LSTLVPDALPTIAATTLLAPGLPLLFMGEEYGETAPFQYFVDHGDPDLLEAVRKGRRREFAHFGWNEDIPDPADRATFERSKLTLGAPTHERQQALLRWTRALIELRKSVPALGAANSTQFGHEVWTFERERVIVMHRWAGSGPAALVVLGYNTTPATLSLEAPAGSWTLRLEAAPQPDGAAGSPSTPSELLIGPTVATLALRPYAARVYLRKT
jgi:maltooligosyltrehalose trehalohydrolase